MKKILLTSFFLLTSVAALADNFRDDFIGFGYAEGSKSTIDRDHSYTGLSYKLSNDLIVGVSYSKIKAKSLSEMAENSAFGLSFSEMLDISYLLNLAPGIVELVGTFGISDGNVTIESNNQTLIKTDLKEYVLGLGFRAAINKNFHLRGAIGHVFQNFDSGSFILVGLPSDDHDFHTFSAEYFISDDISSIFGFTSDGSMEDFSILLKKYY